MEKAINLKQIIESATAWFHVLKRNRSMGSKWFFHTPKRVKAQCKSNGREKLR